MSVMWFALLFHNKLLKMGKKFRFYPTHCGHISVFIYIVQFLFQQRRQKDGAGQNLLYKKWWLIQQPERTSDAFDVETVK